MSSPKFESVKRNNPRIAVLLDRLGEYIRDQVRSGRGYIVPKLAGAVLGLNDGEAFVLLEILAAGGLLQRVYNLYCGKTGALLATVEDPKQLDEVPHCDYCDEDHDLSGLKVEIAFTASDAFFNKAA
jgi:hypothetical protein